MMGKARIRQAIENAKPVTDEDPFDLAAGQPYQAEADSDAGGEGDDAGDEIYDPAFVDEYDHMPPANDEDLWAKVRRCHELDQNDRDNARRLVIHFGDDLIFVQGMGWLVWRDTHWVRDDGELYARLLAQNVVDMIKKEPFFIVFSPAEQRAVDLAKKLRQIDEDDLTVAQQAAIKRADKVISALANKRAKRKNFAISTGNASKTGAMLTQAASIKVVEQTMLDADRLKFNVRNGTLHFIREPDLEQDLTPGADGKPIEPRFVVRVELRPHNRLDYMTKMADVDYIEGAKCPIFDAFLDRCQPEAEMRQHLMVSTGYAMLIGGNDEQKLWFHFGTGANGKSAFIEATGRMAGSYRTVVSPDTITGDGQRGGQQASPDIARLYNTRYVTVEELPKNSPLREELIKALSGGTKMVARFLQRDNFEFEPIFVPILSGNSKPSINGSDYGIWRRVLIVEWGQTIPEAERIPFGKLMAQFDAERSGILNWIVEGVKLYLRDGLDIYIPDQVRNFTQDYRDERDNVGVFADVGIVAAPGKRVVAGVLYTAYTEWCEINGLRAASQRSFGDRLVELGHKKKRGGYYYYLDIKLNPDLPKKHDPINLPPEPDKDDPGFDPGQM